MERATGRSFVRAPLRHRSTAQGSNQQDEQCASCFLDSFVAQRAMSPQNAAIVIVGDADKLRDDLKAFGDVEEVK